MTNPLLDNDGLPAFSHIKPEHAEPAIDALLAENRANIARATRPSRCQRRVGRRIEIHDTLEALAQSGVWVHIPENTNCPWLIHWISAISKVYINFHVALKKPPRKTAVSIMNR